jgi:hypothetical protein
VPYVFNAGLLLPLVKSTDAITSGAPTSLLENELLLFALDTATVPSAPVYKLPDIVNTGTFKIPGAGVPYVNVGSFVLGVFKPDRDTIV